MFDIGTSDSVCLIRMGGRKDIERVWLKRSCVRNMRKASGWKL